MHRRSTKEEWRKTEQPCRVYTCCVCVCVRMYACVRVCVRKRRAPCACACMCANKREADGDERCEIAEKDRRGERASERTSERGGKKESWRKREANKGKRERMRHDCHCPEVTCHRPSKRQQHPRYRRSPRGETRALVFTESASHTHVRRPLASLVRM